MHEDRAAVLGADAARARRARELLLERFDDFCRIGAGLRVGNRPERSKRRLVGLFEPRLNIPYRPVLGFLRLWQYLHFRIGFPAPPFTPHEIRKLAISHRPSSEAAKRDFGYEPIVTPEEAIARCLAHYRERLDDARALEAPTS